MNKLFLLMFLLLSSNLWAGQSTSNGTGNKNLLDGVAWFGKTIADRPIKICYEVSPQFSSAEINFEALISSRFQTWSDYFLNRFAFCKTTPTTEEGTYCLQTKIEITKKCDGNADLQILFGIDPKNKNNLLTANRFNKAAAAAVLESYTKTEVVWGKGFIWIAPQDYYEKNYPNWEKEGSLEATLLHEIGHVFGSEHIQGTVMESNIYELYGKIKSNSKTWANKIDWSRELYTSHAKPFPLEYPALYEYSMREAGKDLFKYLYNREAKGNVEIEYGVEGKLSIGIKDNTLKEEILVQRFNGNIYYTNYGIAFKAYWKESSQKIFEEESQGNSNFFTYYSPSTKKEVTIIINRNLNSKLEIRALLPNYNELELKQFFSSGIAPWYGSENELKNQHKNGSFKNRK